MDLLELDTLGLYFGDPYVINENVSVLQPTIGDIAKYGEKNYFSLIHTITAISSDLKSQLWDMGLDWEEVEDFQLFMMLAPTLNVESTRIILGDVDLSKLRPYKNNQNGQIVLADKETGLIIDMLIYERIVNYLRKVHGLKKKVEHAGNKYTKKILIDEDRMRIEANKNKLYKSFLTPLISSVKCRMGYTKDYVRNMQVFEFFDDVQRLNVINNADALLRGMYSGMIDTKKINKQELNWMRELDKD
jgi:hypothetical protein